MDSFCPSHRLVFQELERLAPDAPFLALGQTALWDEPMKAGVALCAKALGFQRRLVAGVHDTDYFAKLPGGTKAGGFVALPHNDTTTKDLWSAAGEFSALFGSETVVTRDQLQRSGSKLGKIHRERPGALDRATEAWGWRGVVYQGDQTSVIAETPFAPLQDALFRTLDWAIDESLELISACRRPDSIARADQLRALACDATDLSPGASLGEYYRTLLPKLHEFVTGEPCEAETTTTTELLRFNTATAGKDRFKILDLFLNPATRKTAEIAYDSALRGTEIYTLDRFGSWAVPFDLVVPGHGRGTLRIAPKAIIVMAPEPLFITTKKTVTTVHELAEAIERKFGRNCTLVGKAVSLIGMLATEFVFVFHEGASSYVKHTRRFHQELGDIAPKMNPVLRIKYETWDTLSECQTWLRLPEPLRQPFGADELSTKSFAARWRMAVVAQVDLLQQITELRRPIDFVRFLADRFSQSWSEPAQRYEAMHAQLQALHAAIEAVRAEKAIALKALREARRHRNELEHAKGNHWREALFEKDPNPLAWQERERLTQAIRDAEKEVTATKLEWQRLQAKQDALVQAPDIQQAHEQRRDLEIELELKRLKLVRQAITTSQGLMKAAYRPSAWWFPLLCPDGGWFRATVSSAEYYLEPLA